MDFYDSRFKDVLRYILYPILDPISKLVLSFTLHFIDINNRRLTFDQLICLNKYPGLLKYFENNECDLKRGLLYSKFFGLKSCNWYPFYNKTNVYRKYTEEEYKHDFLYKYKCDCIGCTYPGYCKVYQLGPFLEGLTGKPFDKHIKRFRTEHENVLYACGMICSKYYDLSKPPFRKLIHDKKGEYLLYFALLSRNKQMIVQICNQLGVREIDYGLRWLSDKDFMWIVDNYDIIIQDKRLIYIFEWVLSVLSRDRLSGYYK